MAVEKPTTAEVESTKVDPEAGEKAMDVTEAVGVKDDKMDTNPVGKATEEKGEPNTTEKEPNTTTEKEPNITEKEPNITEKEPNTTEKEPNTTEKEPNITEKEPNTTEKKKEPKRAEVQAESTIEESKKEDKKEENSPVEEKAEGKAAATEQTKPDETPVEAEEGGENGNKPDVKVEQHKSRQLEKKIIKQIEFYFGDFNLGRDRFLQGQIKEDNGWVTFEVLLTFNRLKSLTQDVEYIVQCLARSKSGLLIVAEDGLKVRRNPDKPLPEQNKEHREALKARSVYAKGFPTDLIREEVEAFFLEHGDVEHIQLRTTVTRQFKGSVFVVFNNLEDAKKFVEAENVKYAEEEDITRLLKDDYFKKKLEDRKTKKEENLKESEEKKQDLETEDNAYFMSRMTKGAILYIDGLPGALTVDELRAAFGVFGEVAWVEYQKGDAIARIRFIGENEAKVALKNAQADGEVTVKDTAVMAHVLEGDEELDFWRRMFQSQRDRKERMQRGRRGRGGRGYGRSWGGPPAKRRRN